MKMGPPPPHHLGFDRRIPHFFRRDGLLCPGASLGHDGVCEGGDDKSRDCGRLSKRGGEKISGLVPACVRRQKATSRPIPSSLRSDLLPLLFFFRLRNFFGNWRRRTKKKKEGWVMKKFPPSLSFVCLTFPAGLIKREEYPPFHLPAP